MFNTGSYTSTRTPLVSTVIKTEASNFYTNKTIVDSGTKPSSYWINTPEVHIALLPILCNLKEHKLMFTHTEVSYTKDTLDSFKADSKYPGSIMAPSLRAQEKEPLINIVHVKTGITIFSIMDKIGQLEELKPCSMALQNSINHKVRVYRHNNGHQISIVSSEYDWGLLRKIIAFIPFFFPQLELPESIIPLLAEYAGQDYTKWISLIEEWAKKQGFEDKKLKEDLTNLVKNKYKTKVVEARNRKTSIEHEIDRYITILSERYKMLDEVLITISGLEHTPNADNEELYMYVKNHKYIKGIQYDSNRTQLYLVFHSPVSYYDTDAVQTFFKNPNHDIHANPQIRRFVQECFIDNKYEIYTETGVVLIISGSSVNISGTLMTDALYPHPHIIGFGCWGRNSGEIIKALSKNDYVQAIEQVCAATQNINVLDSGVFRHFLNKIQDYGNLMSIWDNEKKTWTCYNDIKKKYMEEEK